MEIFNIFSQPIYWKATLSVLGVLFFITSYSARFEQIKAPLWLLYWALLVGFGAQAFGSQVQLMYYEEGGNEILYLFAQAFLYLISMLLMSLSASQFLIHGYPNKSVTLGIGGLGLFAIVFFLFLSPDGFMIRNMCRVFPLAGFSYVALSLWLEARQKNRSGYIVAALCVSFIGAVYLLPFIGFVASIWEQLWFVPMMLYLVLGLSFLMIYTNKVQGKLDVTLSEIEKNNKQIEEIIKYSPFPIIISRVVDDKIILANGTALKMFGIKESELDRYHFKDLFADSENRRLLNERLEQERVVQDFEILVKTPITNEPFWLLTSANIIDYNYDVVLYSAFQDITSRKNREALLKNQATRDPLTGLYNRRYFEEEVASQIKKAKAEASPFSVMMIDADFFKKVNDTYGHKTGDKVLIELASTAEKALRDKDIVARYGGEEFVVFLPGIGIEQAYGVANRLRESISEVVVMSDNNQEVKFTVSIGVSSSDTSDNIDTLVKMSDEALYKAKQNGRNRVESFTVNDMKDFEGQKLPERRDESQNRHPVFDKENNVEISLLDGASTKGNVPEFIPSRPITPTPNIPQTPDKGDK